MASNPYMPNLSPAIGNGLPGMPVKKTTYRSTVVEFHANAGGPSFYTIPQGFTYFRVILIGVGGTNDAGGGGSCAVSDTFSATPGIVINFSLPIPLAGSSPDARCYFLSVDMYAGGGGSIAGGVARGGFKNYDGGSGNYDGGSAYSPGGAASPNGPGYSAIQGGYGGDGPGGPGRGGSKTPGAGRGGGSMVRIELW